MWFCTLFMSFLKVVSVLEEMSFREKIDPELDLLNFIFFFHHFYASSKDVGCSSDKNLMTILLLFLCLFFFSMYLLWSKNLKREKNAGTFSAYGAFLNVIVKLEFHEFHDIRNIIMFVVRRNEEREHKNALW